MKKWLISLISCVLLVGCTAKEKNENPPIEEEVPKAPVEEKYQLSLAMVGDALIHSAVYMDASLGNNTYDFKPMIERVKPIIQKYDLAFYNQETIIGGKDIGLSTYPRFNSPEEVAEAFIDAGFNMVSLANNHTLDRGEQAILHSVNYWKEKEDVMVAGSYSSEEERQKVDIRTKNGITYTLLAYTTVTNGLSTPNGKEYLLDTFDKEKVKEDIERVRDKVDVLIVSMHWGEEYTHEPVAEEKEIAEFLASLDVDIVIGHHPHVIQPITYIGDTLVIYSLGNFLSGQVGEAKNIGLLASVDIVKTVKGTEKKIEIKNVGTELIYTDYISYEMPDGIAADNYSLYPFSDLNDSILPNYEMIQNKYNAIVTELEPTIQVNITSQKTQPVGEDYNGN